MGIPVGIDIGHAIASIWDDMITDLREKAEQWMKARLSQRARVRVATTLLISIPRYAIYFLLLSKKNQDIIEKIQQKLIWGVRAVHLGIENQRLPDDRGGLASQDLESRKAATAIHWVARMEKRPDLPWVQMAVGLCRDTRTRNLRVE